MKIRVFTAFSGYDSQCLALDRLKAQFPDFDYELVGWSEIDKYAIQAHNALFPQWADRNYGDISKIDWNDVPDFDLFTYSSPCQDFSNAGLQRGGEEGSGTRSSLLWECRRAIVAKRPKYLLLENVAALVSQKFLPLFNKWQAELASYGYSNFAQVLNAKDYGVPQNRERVFLVSILGNASYHFPKEMLLDKRLKDVLESDVDEKYYLSDKTVASFAEHCERKQAEGCGFKFEPTTHSGSRETDNFIRFVEKDDVFIVDINCIDYIAPNGGSGTGYSQYFIIEIQYSDGTMQQMELHTWYTPITVIISDFLSHLKYCPDMEDQKKYVLLLFRALRGKDPFIWEHYTAFVKHSKEGWITDM